MTEQRESLPHP